MKHIASHGEGLKKRYAFLKDVRAKALALIEDISTVLPEQKAEVSSDLEAEMLDLADSE